MDEERVSLIAAASSASYDGAMNDKGNEPTLRKSLDIVRKSLEVVRKSLDLDSYDINVNTKAEEMEKEEAQRRLMIKEMQHHEKEEHFDEELESLLRTNPSEGLTSREADSRLVRFGKNEIPEKKKSRLLKFVMYFWGPIAFLIEASAILAGVLEDWLNFGIIVGLLIINAIIGYAEEAKAESALDALRNTLALKSRVIRDSILKEIDSSLLVPGDVIIVRLGDIVPADARLLGIGATGEKTEGSLLIDQSGLTGESLPVEKKSGNVIYSSSIVKQGQQLAVVAKTADRTFIGRAANLISITNEPGHFQKVVQAIGNFLIGLTLVMVATLLVAKVLKGDKFLETLQYCLILTVASIPVGLPTVLSVTMAVGAKQLAKKQVIVKRLTAVEELAGINILCSDKTGTLTLNHLSLDKPFLKPGFTSEDLLFHAFMASEIGANDAIELAVRNAAIENVSYLKSSYVEGVHSIPGYKLIDFTPFDPISKMTTAKLLRLSDESIIHVAKGAPQVIIRMCGEDDAASSAVFRFAHQGLRALGVARTKPNSNKWELLGLISLLDPPRPDSEKTIRDVRELGTDVKMITGDQLVIAKEVARRLGMHRVILDSEKLVDPEIDEKTLTKRCEKADGFAQVIPEHKYRVVELLQKKGHMVGMTGDGVNDAPALKKANVGIAVHGCTDAARSAADIVLLAPGIGTIVDGIKCSRAIFQRMRSYAVYRITSTIHFLLFFFCTILFLDWSLPSKLIILIALLNDAATLVISVDNAKISPKPDKWRLGQLLTLSFVLGLMLTGASFAHYFIAKEVFHVETNELDTIMYLQISSCPHFVIFSTRLADPFWTNKPSLVFFLAIIGTQIFAMFISVYGLIAHPIGWAWGTAVMGTSVGFFVVMDLVKVLLYKHWNEKFNAAINPLPKKRKAFKERVHEERKMKKISGNTRRLRKIFNAVLFIKKIEASLAKKPVPDVSHPADLLLWT